VWAGSQVWGKVVQRKIALLGGRELSQECLNARKCLQSNNPPPVAPGRVGLDRIGGWEVGLVNQCHGFRLRMVATPSIGRPSNLVSKLQYGGSGEELVVEGGSRPVRPAFQRAAPAPLSGLWLGLKALPVSYRDSSRNPRSPLPVRRSTRPADCRIVVSSYRGSATSADFTFSGPMQRRCHDSDPDFGIAPTGPRFAPPAGPSKRRKRGKGGILSL
jgi:hypothetical protein